MESVSFTFGAAFSTNPGIEDHIPVQQRNFMRAKLINPANDPKIVPRRRIATSKPADQVLVLRRA